MAHFSFYQYIHSSFSPTAELISHCFASSVLHCLDAADSSDNAQIYGKPSLGCSAKLSGSKSIGTMAATGVCTAI
jgi:hypothetical protein